MKQTYSYVVAPRTLEGALKALQNAISKTETYFAEHGEIEEYKRTLERGLTYKRDKVLNSCKAWLAETNAPEYMHQSALDAAYNSLGADLNQWIDGLSAVVPIRYSINGQSKVVAIEDIIVTPNGWQPSENLKQSIIDTYTHTLNPDEVATMKIAEQFAELHKTLCSRGYNLADVIESFAGTDNPNQRAEMLCNSYNALYDSRVTDADKDKIKANQQRFFNAVM